MFACVLGCSACGYGVLLGVVVVFCGMWLWIFLGVVVFFFWVCLVGFCRGLFGVDLRVVTGLTESDYKVESVDVFLGVLFLLDGGGSHPLVLPLDISLGSVKWWGFQ